MGENFVHLYGAQVNNNNKSYYCMHWNA